MKHLSKFLSILFVFFLCIGKIVAQKNDSEHLKFEKIEKKIYALNDSDKKWKLILLYIKESKKEKNPEALVYAYRYASSFSDFPKNLKYADSAIVIGKKSDKLELVTNAYINRSEIYMNEALYQKALDDILIANQYSIQLGDDYINHKTKYYIAQNKIYLGLYEEANKELIACVKYFKTNLNDKSFGKDFQQFYIFSLMSLIDSNTKIGLQKKNKPLIDEAINYLKKNKLSLYIPYFISSEGTTAFYAKDYNTAIRKLSEALRLYNDSWPHNTEVFYLGQANWRIGKHDVAIKYFEEIDKDYTETKKLEPQFRPAYEILIKYYDSLGNKEKQLDYINKLMILDKSYEKNYKYLYTKINKEYDTQKLLLEKNKIESVLKYQRAVVTILFLATFILLSFFGYRFYRLQKIYKERFNKIIAEHHVEKKNNVVERESNENISEKFSNNIIEHPNNYFDIEYYNKIPGINPLFVENILNQLEVFEKENKFLDNQISKSLLSETLGTNPTYLSKIINVYKGKNFAIYINDLRLDYIIELMKNDVKYLNLDVKELAIMSGFTNTQNFSDNFQRKFEIKPSYFMKMMIENVRNSSLSHNPALD